MPKKLTAMENLSVYARMYGVSNIKQNIQEMANDLSLEDFLNKKNWRIIFGQKNRVSLAKSLINKTKITFFR